MFPNLPTVGGVRFPNERHTTFNICYHIVLIGRGMMF